MKTRSIIPLTLVVAASLAAACSGENPQDDGSTQSSGDPVVGGKADAKDPSVVALYIDGQALCTGTLIGPRAVLTARHCVSITTEQVDCSAGTKQIEGDRDPSSILVLVGETLQTATPVAKGKSLFVPATDTLCGEDAAVLILDQSVTSVTPSPVELHGPVTSGQKVRVVGFGKTGDATGAGKKYTRSGVAIEAVSAHEFEVGEAVCSGDSGGPAFDMKTGKVVGIVSRGAPTCQGDNAHNVYTRADAFAWLVERALAAEKGGEGSANAGGGGSSSSPTGRACDVHHHCPKGYHCGATHTCEAAK